MIDVGLAGVAARAGSSTVRRRTGTCRSAAPRSRAAREDTDGQVRDRIQTNGRCEAAIERGDTYGPVSYLAYVPATAIFGWSGKWDSLPAAHATSIAFDLFTILGLALVGLRSAGFASRRCSCSRGPRIPSRRTRSTRTRTTRSCRPSSCSASGLRRLRGREARRSRSPGWTKFGALLVAPLWATYPSLDLRRLVRFASGSWAPRWSRSPSSCSSPACGGGADVLGSHARLPGRTRLPFSLWGWGQYHAEGIPTSGSFSRCSWCSPVVLALVVAVLPRRKGPVELAALTAALLIAFQLTLTHWFYLYLPWVLPFVLLWLLLPRLTARIGKRKRRLDRRGLARSRRRIRRARPRCARRPEPSRTGPGARCAFSGWRVRLHSDHRVVRAVIPASVMKAVPRGSNLASEVWTWVCVPTTAVTRPSSQRASAAFSLVASACTSTRTSGVSAGLLDEAVDELEHRRRRDGGRASRGR